MGLFDKKFCDICGEKIGMLGNRKLSDGNMCKDCAKLLSPFCDDRRNSTLADIKAQLQYREENKAVLRAFSPMITIDGDYKNIYVDTAKGNFVVSSNKPGNWDNENPDVIPISAITSLTLDVKEDRDEIYYKDAQGNNQSYVPPRYEYEYDFTLKFLVNTPWFDDFDVKLNNFRVKNMGSPEYNRYQQLAQQAMNALGVGTMPMNGGMGMNMGYGQPAMGYGQQTGYNQPMNNGYAPANGYNQSINNGYAPANGYNQSMNNGYAPANGYNQPMNNSYNQQMNNGYNRTMNQEYNQQPAYSHQSVSQSWICPACNGANDSGAFCTFCGTPRQR